MLRKMDVSVKHHKLLSQHWFFQGRHAIIRYLFRSNKISSLKDHLCIVTGKLLQKKEVCNKAGAYSSKQQRSDVMQEYCDSIIKFRQWIDENEISEKLNTEIENMKIEDDESMHLIWLMDHASIPISFSFVDTPALAIPEYTQLSCPNCAHTFDILTDNALDTKPTSQVLRKRTRESEF